jgi:hypothetical protein
MFVRPHVSRNEIREKILPGCAGFSFGLPNIEGCVGMGIAPDFTAGGFVWHIKEAQLLDESGKCIIVWDRDTMHHDIKRKMGVVRDGDVDLPVGLLDFGPYMRTASGSTQFDPRIRFSLRVVTSLTASTDPIPVALNLYMFQHQHVTIGDSQNKSKTV